MLQVSKQSEAISLKEKKPVVLLLKYLREELRVLVFYMLLQPSLLFKKSVIVQSFLFYSVQHTRSFKKFHQNVWILLARKKLEENSIHLRVHSHGLFQNFITNHSYDVSSIFLVDGSNNVILFHLHNSRALGLGNWTNQTNLATLDLSFEETKNITSSAKELLTRDVPVVSHIDWDTFWSNLMSKSVSTTPEMRFQCKEAIAEEKFISNAKYQV